MVLSTQKKILRQQIHKRGEIIEVKKFQGTIILQLNLTAKFLQQLQLFTAQEPQDQVSIDDGMQLQRSLTNNAWQN